MLLAEILTGIILIISGLLVRKNPHLIAGYNTMSKKEKDSIDIAKLSLMMHNFLICIGSIVVITGVILNLFGIEQSLQLLSTSGIVVIGLILMIFKGQRFKTK